MRLDECIVDADFFMYSSQSSDHPCHDGYFDLVILFFLISPYYIILLCIIMRRYHNDMHFDYRVVIVLLKES